MPFFDQPILLLIARWRSPALTLVMKLLTDFGGTGSLTLLTTLLATVLFLKHYKKEASLLIGAMLSGVLVSQTLKHLINRVRPQIISHLVVATSPSFPSGHAMNNTIFYLLLTYLSWRIFKNKELSFVVAFVGGLLVALIGFSRLYLGVHYPSDVIAGWMLGVLVGFGSIFLATKSSPQN